MLCCRQKQHDIQDGRFKSGVMKPKPIVTRLHAFRLSETCKCCCWFTGLPVSFVISQSYYSVLGFGLAMLILVPRGRASFGQRQES